MNEPGPITGNKRGISRPVFISFATSDRKQALSICTAIEQRGTSCWISTRDVEPGANYQEAIARTIRGARAMVLIFSKSANRSDEIKKELSLASRYKVPVIALRLDEVEPSDAFAYELSTRQWIDYADEPDKSIDALTARLSNATTRARDVASSSPLLWRSRGRLSRATIGLSTGVALVLAVAGTWWLLRVPQAQHSLQVRLAGFQRLSNDLPPTMPAAMHDELTAAFGDDGVITVSDAPQPPKGSAPAYALSGTIGREGSKIKIIARLVNERTGTTLWSRSNESEAAQSASFPRRVAIDTSMVIRCGLFGISTYPKELPEATVADYFEACQNPGEPDKALDFARKVVGSAADFSWGWSAIATADFNALVDHPPEDRIAALRAEGLRAADKAVSLDRTNSEAYAFKGQLLNPGNLVAREKLFQQAVNARALPCGCEHHFYGDFLTEVGRNNDAIREYRRSIDIMALNSNSQMSLAQVLFDTGRPDLAKPHLDAALALDDDPYTPGMATATLAPVTGDYGRAIEAVNDAKLGPPPPIARALTAAFAALISKNPEAKRIALAKLNGMPPETHGGLWVELVAMLGDNREALDATVAAALDPKRLGARSWLFTPPMAGVLRDPTFVAAAKRLGLIVYWRATRTKPDVCLAKSPPPFCRII